MTAGAVVPVLSAFGGAVRPSPAVAGGVAYVGSDDGRVRAVGAADRTPATSTRPRRKPSCTCWCRCRRSCRSRPRPPSS
ncbi:PQQ-binding-like beta-propeller repeat protein [Streptomyces sp. NPDC050548]|uniref:PQQ-binding-like beta-propeller repeat protein n=1 Tax=Streptomyces sp. NPDC050548 TaxID=3365629 RepID=UPI0037B53337